MTPFEAVYGQNPLLVLPYMSGVSKVQEVDRNLIIYMKIIRTLKKHLAMAQNRMKQQVEQGSFERQFSKGNQVFLHLQPYK
jgi:hypothetical protein